MIAKRITSKAAKPRIARLVRYVVAAQGGIDPRSWSRTADYMLSSGTSSRGEKVGGVRVTNCHTDDPAAATTLIEATQASNKRSKTDKTYHLVFSFPPGEQPAIEVLHKIEDELCAAIGYADHQRISAVHIDTDHLHVHVAINKVHPKGLQNIEPYYDKKKLMETCERLELEHGLQRTNHGLTGQEPKSKMKEKQAQAEIHSGIQTLTGFIANDLSPAIKAATTWSELHGILAAHGLSIKKRGAGLVVGSGNLWLKPSQCDRSFSMKALTDRLGPFESSKERTKKEYQARPRQKHPSSAALFDKYQSEKRSQQLKRVQALERLHYLYAVRDKTLKQQYVGQKLFIRATIESGQKRKAMLKILSAQLHATRQGNRLKESLEQKQIISDTSVPLWTFWLSYKAASGDMEALAVLRAREAKAIQGDTLTARNIDESTVIIHKMNPLFCTDGSLFYHTADGGCVIDRATHVQSLRTTETSVLLALEIAATRFAGQALIVEGTDNFKDSVALFAGMHNIDVRFADPKMEKERKRAMRQKPKTRGKSIDDEREL